MNLGMEDPVATQRAIHDGDEQNLAERQFVLSLAEWTPSWEGLAEELLHAVKLPQAAAPVRAALKRLCGDEFLDSKGAAKLLGYKLRALRDRRFDGWGIVRIGDSRKGIRWGLNFSQPGGDAAMVDKVLASSPHSQIP